MKDIIRRGTFIFIRFWVRCFTRHYRIAPPLTGTEPSVYLVHHQNLRGPVTSVAWFNIPARIWVLHVFCNHRKCFRQYYDYTFTKRFGMSKLLAAVTAYPLSFLVSGLMKVIEGIPVYRGSREIVKTLEQSISTLTSGQSVILCPDIDYKDTSSAMGDMYDGFLYLEKYYLKATGRHLAFIPLYISKSRHTIDVGQAVYFNPGEDFKQEKIKVYDRIKEEFSRLEGQEGNKPIQTDGSLSKTAQL